MAITFAETLRQWRKTHNLRQKEAAAILNIKVRTYEGYEIGHNSPPENLVTREVIEKRMAEYVPPTKKPKI
jgi:transcriptional regulator with XRE-family HTH domain